MAPRPRKLHEFLGAQKQVFGQAEKVRTDLLATFDKRKHLFGEGLKQFQPDGEDKKPVIEAQSTLQTTIPQELRWMQPIIAKALDSEATIDQGNTVAKADVVLDDDSVLLRDVPATQLLQLDKRLGELHQFVTAIPTLDPAKGFTRAKDRGVGVYQAREVTKRRTSKEQTPLVLAPATEKHPAQVQLITKDVEIGTIIEQEWSGLLTPATKAKVLERLEELRRAVKQARARANDVIVEEQHIGDKLLGYVFAPVYAEAE
jgi:hypothetical protein